MSNEAAVAEALGMLGAAWRSDWSDFDGRTLRDQLGDLAAALSAGEPFDARTWAFSNSICPESYGWVENYNARSAGLRYGQCDHSVAFYAALVGGTPDGI